MRSPLIHAALFMALIAMPLGAKTGAKAGHASTGVKGASSTHVTSGGSVGTAPAAAAGYHSSAGYGSAYGWGYKGWTKNGYKDGQWRGIPYSSPTSPSAKHGNSSTSYASGSEMELIQQRVTRSRAQEAQQHSQPSATPANSAKQP